jgi:hypothetical protein
MVNRKKTKWQTTIILTKAISNIVQLYITQVFSIKVTTSYRYCKRMVSFNPSPEWDIMTTTAMHIKLSRNKTKSLYKDSLCHSCSTCHFLLKCTYTVWILSGNVHMSYMYRFYLYIYCYLTIYHPKSTWILTKAISNIVQLYIMQVFSSNVTTSYRCCKRMVSFKPSPEWDIMTTTAMHIKLSRNKTKSLCMINWY